MNLRFILDYLVLSLLLSIEFSAGHVFNTASMLICYALVYAIFDAGSSSSKKVKK